MRDSDHKDIMASLQELSHKMNASRELAEVLKRVEQGHFRSVDEGLMQKRIEDGVIKNLHNASDHQLAVILSRERRFFKYYADAAYNSDNLEFVKIK